MYMKSSKNLIHRFFFYSYGEVFDLSKHPQGTEVKAITYSNMQIHEAIEPRGSDTQKSQDGLYHLFVIIDI